MSGNNRRNPHDPRSIRLSAQTEGENRRRRQRRQGEEEKSSEEPNRPEATEAEMYRRHLEEQERRRRQPPTGLSIRIPPNSTRNDRRVPAAPRSPPQQDNHGEEKYADENAQNSLQQIKIIF
jgi:hypothetical protein